jgi:lipopolysaccharide transport system permease protein
MSARSKQTIRMQPTNAWSLPDFREVWEFRDLVLMIALRDLRSRYKQTVLGIFWVVLQPLLTSGVFAIIFGNLANLKPQGNVSYLVFANVGTVTWTLFENSVTRASNSLLFGVGIISKVYFPRIILPISSVLSGLIDFLIGFVMTLVLLLVFELQSFQTDSPQVLFTPRMLLMPIFLLGIMLLAISVGMLISSLSIQRRDLLTALPFLLKVAMYSVPVVYSIERIPAQWLTLYTLNPLVGFIQAVQWAMLNLTTPFPINEFVYALITTTILFLLASLIYRRVERSAVDSL